MNKEMDFQKGDIISYCHELYEVVENFGYSGTAYEYLGNGERGDYLKMYWHYDGEDCKLIKRAK